MNPIAESLLTLKETIAQFTLKIVDFIYKYTSVKVISEKVTLAPEQTITYNLSDILTAQSFTPADFDFLAIKLELKTKVNDPTSPLNGLYTESGNVTFLEIESEGDWNVGDRKNILYGIDEVTGVLTIFNSANQTQDIHIRVEIPRK
jgi:hypothetical protein